MKKAISLARVEIASFGKDSSGSILILFALAILPLIFALGMALDFSQSRNVREHLQSSADSIALAALAEASDRPVDMAKMERAFLAGLPESVRGLRPEFDISVVSADGKTFRSTVTYSVDMQLHFAGVLGLTRLDFEGVATATITKGADINVHLWLDSSASMGVAATEEDRDRLRELSRDDPEHSRCAFACHIPTRLSGGWATSEQRAHAFGVKLRHDLMKENVIALINRLDTDKHPQQTVSYSLGAMARGFEARIAMTDEIEEVREKVEQFNLTAGPAHGNAASRLSDSFRGGLRTLPAQGGDGSASRPRDFVVIVTDGMQFDWGGISPGPVDARTCSDIKARGISVAVIRLRYVELTGDSAFNTWVRPVHHLLGPALQECASGGLYFSADTPAEIETAFAKLADELRDNLRLAY